MQEKRLSKPCLPPEKERKILSGSGVRDAAAYISVGRVIRVHGLRGQVKVIPYTDTLERFESLRSVFLEFPDGAVSRYDIEKAKIQNGFVFLKFSGIDDRTAAESLQGAWVSVRREDIPVLAKDSYYTFDLVGLEVRDENGAGVGTVTRIEEYPANAVLVVESETEEIWIPAIRDVVIEVNLDTGLLTVRLPEGLPTYPKGGC